MLAYWQAQALRNLTNDCDFLIYSCNNSRPGPRRLRHALYYLLNLFTIRNPLTRRTPIPADLAVVAYRDFEAEWDGAWQRLPSALLAQVRQDGPAAIVKFGMGLIKVPPAGQLGIPILSYHHGDPGCIRGRPAGFYEMLNGVPVMGQVVQRLSNALDAGDIVASAETKVMAHSYRTTLIEAYRHSPLILGRAIENSLEGRSWRPDRLGRIYRLPGNVIVLRFLLKQWRHAVSRIFYGLFKEKHWSVATVAIGAGATMDSLQRSISRTQDWRTLPTPAGYRFLADPFHHPKGGLLVEALNSWSSRGEILHVGEGKARRLSGRGGHHSYPATILDNERWYVIPEISDWSPAQAFPLGDVLGDPIELRIPGRPALLDPTPFHRNGTCYLFGNLATEGASVLRLWLAESLHDEFTEHPSSPVRISPNGSRMAGGLCSIGGRLIRFGQDSRGSYGDGLTVFEVTHMDEHRYSEDIVSEFRFDHCSGPHTLNLDCGQAAFDFYVERFSLLAGVRRWRDRRAARRP